jgi:hypothetical protein
MNQSTFKLINRTPTALLTSDEPEFVSAFDHEIVPVENQSSSDIFLFSSRSSRGKVISTISIKRHQKNRYSGDSNQLPEKENDPAVKNLFVVQTLLAPYCEDDMFPFLV